MVSTTVMLATVMLATVMSATIKESEVKLVIDLRATEASEVD